MCAPTYDVTPAPMAASRSWTAASFFDLPASGLPLAAAGRTGWGAALRCRCLACFGLAFRLKAGLRVVGFSMRPRGAGVETRAYGAVRGAAASAVAWLA